MKYEVLIIETILDNEDKASAMWTEVFDNANECEQYVAGVFKQNNAYVGEVVYTGHVIAWNDAMPLSHLPIAEY